MGHIVGRSKNAAGRIALADATAGVIGSVVSVLAFYPIDVWKTSLQAGLDGDEATANKDSEPFNIGEVHRSNHKTDGKCGMPLEASSISQSLPTMSQSTPELLARIRLLFRGLPHKIVHTIVSSFTYFYVYSLVQTKYANYRRSFAMSQRDSISISNNAGISTSTVTKLLLTAFSAIMNTCITLPLDTISSRKQAGTSAEIKYSARNEVANVENSFDGGDFNKNTEKNVILTEKWNFVSRESSETESKCASDDFRSTRCNSILEDEEYHSANEDEEWVRDGSLIDFDEGPQIFQQARNKMPAPISQTNDFQRREVFIRNPEKFRFSFSTNLPEESFGNISSAHSNHTANKIQQRLDSIASLWNGLLPAVLLCSNPAIQYTMYDTLKSGIIQHRWKDDSGSVGSSDESYNQHQKSKPSKLSMGEAFILGLISKFFATVITYPLIRAKVMLMVSPSDSFEEGKEVKPQTCVRRSSAHNVRNSDTSSQPNEKQRKSANTKKPPRSLLLLLVYIFRKEGARGIYKGCSIQLLHTILKSALLMMVREKITFASRQFFNIEG